MDNKKVLLVSYYWPPSGGIAVLRSLKLAKYLHHFGWEPIIFTAKGAAYPTHDESNFKDVNPDWKIIKQKIWEPYTLFKLFSGRKQDSDVSNYLNVNQKKTNITDKIAIWIRSNFFIPDARAFWVKPSIRKISNFLNEHKVDAIYSCGPAHTNSLIASRVSQKFGIPHLADFQDPWTQVDYFAKLTLCKRSLAKHLKLEQEVLSNASAVSIVSHHWAADLKKLCNRPISVIPWGFDYDDYEETHVEQSSKFIIIHTGLIGADRNPSTFLHTINKMIASDPGFGEKCEIHFYGFIDEVVKETIRKHDRFNIIKVFSPIARDTLLKKMREASVLLLLLNKQANAAGRIPGKLFEYLALRKQILTLGELEGDASQIVKKSKAGIYSDYENSDLIESYLSDIYEQFVTGNLGLNKQENIDEYSNYNTTSKFANLLDNIAS